MLPLVKQVMDAAHKKRLRLKWSQARVAKRAGVSPSIVARLERGDTSVLASDASRILYAVGAKIKVS